MDREAITRRDFPTGRRGYDPEAVDAHLRRVADEVDALRARAAAPAPAPGLAAAASEQVRAILDAAERGAAQVQAQAGREAGEHVARAGSAAEGLIAGLGALERELGELLEAVRTGTERLNRSLAGLEAQVQTLGAAAEPLVPRAPATVAAPAEEDYAAAAPATVDGEDEAGARLAALNLALGGAPREEAAAYLAEHFGIGEPGALLDDVYARADG